MFSLHSPALVLSFQCIRITWKVFETSQCHKAASCFHLLSHICQCPLLKNTSPMQTEAGRSGWLQGARVAPGCGSRGTTQCPGCPGLTCRLLPFQLHLILSCFSPTFLYPHPGSPRLPLGDAERLSVRTTASPLLWPLTLPMGSLLTVAHCFPVSAKVRLSWLL